MKSLGLAITTALLLAHAQAKANEARKPTAAAAALRADAAQSFLVGFEFTAVDRSDRDCATQVLVKVAARRVPILVSQGLNPGGAIEYRTSVSLKVPKVDASVDRVAEQLSECRHDHETSQYQWSLQRKLI